MRIKLKQFTAKPATDRLSGKPFFGETKFNKLQQDKLLIKVESFLESQKPYYDELEYVITHDKNRFIGKVYYNCKS